MSAIWRSVQTVRTERPTFLYLDEFQTMVNLPIEPDDMLARARGLGLGLTLAHQHLDQLPNNVQQAIMNNAKSKIVFQASSGDSNVVAREFGTTVDQDDLQHLGRYEAMARIMTPTGMSPPITVAMAPPAKGNGHGKDVVAYSRQKYGRPISEVEQGMLARKTDAPTTAPSSDRPRISGGWE
jgi:DNA helicase HerA-like ATPase